MLNRVHKKPFLKILFKKKKKSKQTNKQKTEGTEMVKTVKGY